MKKLKDAHKSEVDEPKYRCDPYLEREVSYAELLQLYTSERPPKPVPPKHWKSLQAESQLRNLGNDVKKMQKQCDDLASCIRKQEEEKETMKREYKSQEDQLG